jgi:CHAT domain/TIR domain
MRIFISCSGQDRSWAELLAARLRQAGLEVWLDRDLAGGQAWWDTVLAHLRSCSAVVVGVSRAYLKSRACHSQRAYAVNLGKPVLPVAIESIDAAMLPSDLARLQIIDCSRPDDATAFRLIAAIFALPPPQSLPDRLPEPPSVPASYLSAIAAHLVSPSLSLDEQLAIIGKLEDAVGPTADPDELQAATEMLRELAGRPDLFASAARRIASLLVQADAADQLRGPHLAADAARSAMPPGPNTLRGTTAAPPPLWGPAGNLPTQGGSGDFEGTAGQKLLDFDVAIESLSGGYRTRVLASPAGEAYADFAFPFTDQDLEILVLKVAGSVGRARRQARRIESPERQMLETFGGRLFQTVFPGPVRDCLGRSRLVAEGRGAGVRIRLRLPGELANVPWEYLYDDQYGFLCLSSETALVRYVDMPVPVRPLPISPPLRILAMIATPSDLPELEGEEEWAKLNTALGDLTGRGIVQVDRLAVGTLSALQRPLRLHDYHVLHFIGHGLYDEEAQDGALALEGADGRTRLVTGRDVGVMIRGHRSLRLVVLNACQGARSARDDPFGGVAQALVRQGVPAVIAMQFEISDPAALVFSQSFYQAIADGLPVDGATVEARRAIFAAGNEVEWATPVLYLRSPDGRVFSKNRHQPRQGAQPTADNVAAARDQPTLAFIQTDTDPEPHARELVADQATELAPFPPPFVHSQEPKAGETKVFISYSHRDARYRQQLETHLSALRRQGVIAEWHDHKIMPGVEWRDAIDRNLDAAECVLLLVTPDFIASDYCYSVEMQRALNKHQEGRGLVIPVIVRPADWQHTPLRDLEALPEGAKPVIEWARRDRAWLRVAEGVRLALASSSQAKPEREARGGDTRRPRDGADLAILEQQARSLRQAGSAASAEDQYAALVPVTDRAPGPGHPNTLADHGSLANWSARTGSHRDDTPDALEGEAGISKLQREIAAMNEFDVPADKGLTRVQASEALKRHGINPKAFGSWVRHGWVIRNGDRRYLSPKGRQWLTDHQALP